MSLKSKLKLLLVGVVLSSVVIVWILLKSVNWVVAVAFGCVVVSLSAVWMVNHGFRTIGVGPRPTLPDLTLPLHSSKKRVRFVCVSDTHNQHNKLHIPEGDVLLHAGDFTVRGTKRELRKFNEWLGRIKRSFKHIVVIPGNHDLSLDTEFYEANWAKWHKAKEEKCGDELASEVLTNCTHYLHNSCATVEGVKICGQSIMPHVPIKRMAFGSERNSDELKQAYAQVPEDTDILITHAPPRGVLDRVLFGFRVGCEAAREAVKRIKPKFHVFGHIHEAFGVQQVNGTTFINCAQVCTLYKVMDMPIVFDVYVDADCGCVNDAKHDKEQDQ